MRFKNILYFTGILLIIASCNKSQEIPYLIESGERFHTIYHITYQHDKALTAQIDSVFDTFNDALNPFDERSLIAKFNRNESDKLHPMLEDVITEAIKVSELTDGVYDITGAPLFDLWGFGTKKGVTKIATEEQIQNTLKYVGYDKIIIDRSNRKLKKKDERLQINPSSLSKGYVTDLVAQELEKHGVTNYLVEIGGEIVANGVNPHNECWKIGISKPVVDNNPLTDELIYAITLCEKVGVASSGDYRNYKIIEGKRLAHTIDVKTGYPAHQDILSATVVAPTSMEADAWATAFMAMGLEASKKILAEQHQLAACLIYSDSVTGEFLTYEHGLDIIEIKKK